MSKKIYFLAQDIREFLQDSNIINIEFTPPDFVEEAEEGIEILVTGLKLDKSILIQKRIICCPRPCTRRP